MRRPTLKSAAHRAELVAEFSQGSESERDFCIRRGIKMATLRKWAAGLSALVLTHRYRSTISADPVLVSGCRPALRSLVEVQ